MSNASETNTCKTVCWLVAGVAGLVLLWVTSGAVTFVAAVVLGAVLAVILGVVLTRLVCPAASEARMADPSELRNAASPAQSARVATGETAAPPPEPGPAPEAPPQDPAAPAGAEDAPKVQAGTLLDGEEEIAARKGAWTYGAGAAPTAPAGAGDGRRPEAMSGPRGGRADDLRRIKGVGPKLAAQLNDLGIYHFDQIAAWGPEEVAWMDANLKGFRGRVSRDGWVAQAAALAAGGDAE